MSVGPEYGTVDADHVREAAKEASRAAGADNLKFTTGLKGVATRPFVGGTAGKRPSAMRVAGCNRRRKRHDDSGVCREKDAVARTSHAADHRPGAAAASAVQLAT